MITTEYYEQKDPRLGRNKVHDSRSLDYQARTVVDRSKWFTHFNRIYDPLPNPNQPNGCCTACAKSMQLNALGNRKKGRVLDMTYAQKLYTWETQNDQFPGEMPTDDTGSNGLASCKGAQHYGTGGAYYWYMGGADEVIQAVLGGRVISVGTKWYEGMFNQDENKVIKPTGSLAGGHQYVVRGYSKPRDLALIRCWWGPGYRDAYLARGDLDDLLRDGGDAHWQVTA